MGIVTNGIPHRITLELAKIGNCQTFVETGTCYGQTTRWASDHFRVVLTIEKAKPLYRLHSDQLASIKGVTPFLGDSRDVLPKIIGDLGPEPALYWLDGHWSGGETAGDKDECPLLDEIACLSNRTQDIVLIDDARLFLSAPPSAHDASQWPTIPDILDAFHKANLKPFVQIIDDVIFAVPNDSNLIIHLVAYAQERADSNWEAYLQQQQSDNETVHKPVNLLSKIRQKFISA